MTDPNKLKPMTKLNTMQLKAFDNMPEKAYNGKPLNGIANLIPIGDADRARELQAKGAETKRLNKEAREALKMTAKQWKEMKEEVLPSANISALDILKLAMFKAMNSNDMDEVTRIAAIVAEYEQPKLSRVDQTTKELPTDELSDEQIEEYLQKAAKASKEKPED